MTLDQIKKSVDAGLKVYWRHEGYRVVKDKFDRYLIGYDIGGNGEHYAPLSDECDPSDFFGAYVRD